MINDKLNLIPPLSISSKINQKVKITLLESSAELIDKFKAMDKKYTKLAPSIKIK